MSYNFTPWSKRLQRLPILVLFPRPQAPQDPTWSIFPRSSFTPFLLAHFALVMLVFLLGLKFPSLVPPYCLCICHSLCLGYFPYRYPQVSCPHFSMIWTQTSVSQRGLAYCLKQTPPSTSWLLTRYLLVSSLISAHYCIRLHYVLIPWISLCFVYLLTTAFPAPRRVPDTLMTLNRCLLNASNICSRQMFIESLLCARHCGFAFGIYVEDYWLIQSAARGRPGDS